MMKKIMIVSLIILMVSASFLSGCVEEEKEDGTGIGVGTLRLQITDKPGDLDIIYANVSISMVQVHKSGVGEAEEEDDNEEDDNGDDDGFVVDADGEYEGEVWEYESVMDQFQWDVELDPGIFEPNIPTDYERIERPGIVEL